MAEDVESLVRDLVHKVAVVGQHVIEHVQEHPHLTLNGVIVAAEDVTKLLRVLAEMAPLVGVNPAEALASLGLGYVE